MVRMKLISPEQAVHHPARSQLTRSLGAGLGLQVDIVRQPIEQHDVFILCSDGLWDELAPHELAEAGRALVSGSTPTPAALAKQLVDTAIERGAADNVTAVVVRVATQLPIPAAESRRSFFRRRG
jgi:serine/threonine protein phosphatase PrpC